MVGEALAGKRFRLPAVSLDSLRKGRMVRTLVIGYGNLDRGDDGVAYWVVNALRQRLGQERLSEEETGLEQLGAQTDSIFVTQLAPELMDTVAGYDQVVFVDAHACPDLDSLCCAPVYPEYTASAFTHHITPAMFLALLQALHHREPVGYLVTIRGYDFDFHRGLSAATEALVGPAVEQLIATYLKGGK